MKQISALIVILLASMGTFAQSEYTSKETTQIVNKMMDAHGGLEKWRKTKTFSFDNIMFSDLLPDQKMWVNKVTVDHKTRRVYQKWSLHNATMAFDGKKAWSVNWKVGNPPKFEALFFYYFLNLPWITLDENVKLSNAKRIKHKAFKNEVFVIDMSFREKPAVGKTKIDSYKLYIDSKTYLLGGYEYMLGYGHMLDLMELPADKKLFGPMFRINDSFTNVDGLIYPNRMHTGNLDQTQVYGYHAILNYSLTNKFDENKMKMPKNAVVDKSSAIRNLQK